MIFQMLGARLLMIRQMLGVRLSKIRHMISDALSGGKQGWQHPWRIVVLMLQIFFRLYEIGKQHTDSMLIICDNKKMTDYIYKWQYKEQTDVSINSQRKLIRAK